MFIRDGDKGGGGGNESEGSVVGANPEDQDAARGPSPEQQNVFIKAVFASPLRIVQELCESRGGRPGLSVLTSLLVSVDVKIYCTVLRHWSQLVPNMSHDI